MKSFGLLFVLMTCLAGCAAPTAPTTALRLPSNASVASGSTVDADADGDGISDSYDNCPGVANPGQRDSEDDGIGDDCDFDDDNDGLVDDRDNCVLTANPDQRDTDGDRLGDACDADDDNDGFDDSVDWCPGERGPINGCLGSIPRLIAQLDGLALDSGVTQGLRAKLEAAEAAIARGNPSAAKLLEAFIAELEALARNGTVSQVAADALIFHAQAVIAQL